jgi:Phage integrase family
MAQRHQRGWLKKEKRAQGETWVLFFRTNRQSDGKRVENKVPIGLVQHLPEASSAWAEVERLHVPINRVDVRRGLIFGDLAQHYAEHELAEASESIRPKAHTTIKGYERVLRNRLLPRWGNRIALGIEPLEMEQWLRALKNDPRRFGFHNLRHSLASFLIRIRTDPKTVQTLLRDSDVKLTLQFYTHAVSRDRMVAAGKMLTAILSHAPDKNGLIAD